MRFAILGGAFAVLLAVGGWLGWGAYQDHAEKSEAVRSAQASAVIFERLLAAKDEDGMTFVEYGRRSSTAIDSLDKEATILASKAWSRRIKDRDTVIAFIDECKAMSRLAALKVRLLMEESNAQEAYDKATADLDDASSSQREWRYKRFTEASDDLVAVLQKRIDLTAGQKAKIEKLLAADEALKSSLGASVGISMPVLEEFRKGIAADSKQDESKG